MLSKLIEFKLLQIFESTIRVDDNLKDALSAIDSRISKDILKELSDKENIETENDLKGIVSITKSNTPNYFGVEIDGLSSSDKKIKIGRFIKALSSKYSDKDINIFINKYNALYKVKDLDVHFLSGDEIAEAYKKDSTICHFELKHNCMLDKPISFFDLYTKNPNKVNLAVLYNEEGLISARALLWKTDQGDIVMDRVYASSEELKGLMSQWGKMEGYVQLYDYESIDLDNLEYTVTLDKFEFDNYPYLDTFKFLSVKGVLSNSEFERISYYELQNSEGSRRLIQVKNDFWKYLDTQTENITDITEFLEECNIKDYEIHEDFSVTINDRIADFSNKGLFIIPIKIKAFNGHSLILSRNEGLNLSRSGLPEYINGNVYLAHCKLRSLSGLPKEIGGYLDITFSKLENFVGGPIKVGKSLLANHSSIKSLEGAPREIGRNFEIMANKIENFVGCPLTIGGDLIANSCNIKSLEGISETSIGGKLNISNNRISMIDYFPKNIGTKLEIMNSILKSLEGFPEEINFSIDFVSNNLRSLEGSPKIVNGNFNVSSNYLKDLTGSPRIINGNCYLHYNHELVSLEGAPEVINGNLYIESCGVKFEESEIREKINVSGDVIC